MPVERNPAVPVAAPARAAVDRALAGLSGPPRRSDLLPLLHTLHDDLGWLSEEVLRHLADRMGLPFPDVWGVVTFYALFRLERPRGVAVHVCDDVACRLRGAEALLRELEAQWGPPRRFGGGAHGTPPRHTPAVERPPGADWETVACLGQCDHAPVAIVAGRLRRRVTVFGLVAATRHETRRA